VGLKEIGLECRGENDNELQGSVKCWELLFYLRKIDYKCKF